MAETKTQDALTLLKEDHRAVEKLFKEFENAKGDGRKEKLAREICFELTVHTTIEEEIFYPACKGKIDLTIKSVTVAVTTSAKITEGVNAGAQVQPESFLKLGVTGGLGRSLTNSEVLTFTLEPVSLADGRAIAAQPSELFHVLTNLRESLLRSGDTTPCLKFPDKDQKNSVEFGFTATKSANAGFAVNLFIFSLGASRGDERTAANKITIAFNGEGQAIQ